MAPRKLSDSDKRQITSIYCQPGETTSTLANKFDISSSTVSRVLKQMLPDEEYAKLMKWKRSGERGSFPLASSDVVEQLEVAVPTSQAAATTDAESTTTEQAEVEQQSDETDDQEGRSPIKETPARRSRRRVTTEAADDQTESVAVQPEEPDEAKSVEDTESSEETEEKSSKPKPVLKQRSQPPAATSEDEDNDDDDDDDEEVAAWVSEGLEDAADYAEESDEDWDEEDWDDESEEDEAAPQPAPREAELTIHSFDNFSLTKSCYLVVDRTAELVTCPLKDFSELGKIPPGEEQARTLPIFDNHRIARRFARRNQRIIKVPDGVMLTKTQEYLQAKGITRILFDGQVYALSH